MTSPHLFKAGVALVLISGCQLQQSPPASIDDVVALQRKMDALAKRVAAIEACGQAHSPFAGVVDRAIDALAGEKVAQKLGRRQLIARRVYGRDADEVREEAGSLAGHLIPVDLSHAMATPGASGSPALPEGSHRDGSR